jgi:ribosomal protein L30/L7E
MAEAKKTETKKAVKTGAVKASTAKTDVGFVPMVRVTMVHGLGSCTKRQIAIAKALRLARPGDTRELPNTPATLGACKKLEHLLKVEPIAGGQNVNK